MPGSPPPVTFNSPMIHSVREKHGETKIKSHAKKLALKVWEAVKFIVAVIVCCWLYWMNSTLFAIGFVAGLVFSDKIEGHLSRIKTIWKKQTWQMGCVLGLGMFLSLPVAIASSSLFAGCYFGHKLAREATNLSGV